MTIKLYELCGADEKHLFSPHCWKIRYALAHKGLDYETVPTPFTKVAGTEGGDGRTVPVIRDGDHVMDESFEIAKYLEEKYPDAPSLFNGEGGVALSRMIISWSQSQLHPAVAKIAVFDIYKSLAPEDQEFFRTSREKIFGCTLEEFDAKFPKDGKSLNELLLPMHMTLKTQPYIGGETPLFADYVVFGALQWLRVCSTHGVKAEGPTGEWFERMLDLYDGLGRKAPAAS